MIEVALFKIIIPTISWALIKMMKATEAVINKDNGMSMAVKAVKKAMAGGPDYSNGAYFWDGVDIKTHYKTHFKVRHGIKFLIPRTTSSISMNRQSRRFTYTRL